MIYDAEVARLVDLYSTKCSTLTGKPEHRKKAALNLLREMADAIKKIVREETLQFYEGQDRNGVGALPLGPLFQPLKPYVPIPQPPPGAKPPIRG